MTLVDVFVPAGPMACPAIRPGSAIVGTPGDDGRVVVDYEDGGFAPAGFADLAFRAWGRHVDRYPTVARGTYPAEKLTLVAVLDTHRGVVMLEGPQSAALLEAWAPGASAQLEVTSGRPARQREFDQYLAVHPEVRMNRSLTRSLAQQMGVDGP